MKIANYHQAVGRAVGEKQTNARSAQQTGARNSKFQQMLTQQSSAEKSNRVTPLVGNVSKPVHFADAPVKKQEDGYNVFQLVGGLSEEDVIEVVAGQISLFSDGETHISELIPEQIALLLMSHLDLHTNLSPNEHDAVTALKKQLQSLFKIQDDDGQYSEKLLGEIAEKLTQIVESQAAGKGWKKSLLSVVNDLQLLDNQQFRDVNNSSARHNINHDVLKNLVSNMIHQQVYRVEGNNTIPTENIVIPHPMNHINETTITVHERAPEAVRNQQFTEQLLQVINAGKFSRLGNGHSQLVVRLHPEHLGSLTIKLVQENGELTAKIIASTASAKELIEANINQLRHAIPAQNIIIEKFDIFMQQTSDFTFRQQQQSREQQHPDDRQHDNNQSEQDSLLDFKDTLAAEVLNFKV